MLGTQEAERAWAAGLFEGAGYIGCYPHKTENWWCRRLQIDMTDEDIVRRFHGIAGCGTVYHKSKSGNAKDQWRWIVGDWAGITATLEWLIPYLGERRREAADFLLSHPPRRYTK